MLNRPNKDNQGKDKKDKKDKKKDTYVLGSIIHNPKEIDRLANKGLKTITHEDFEKISGDNPDGIQQEINGLNQDSTYLMVVWAKSETPVNLQVGLKGTDHIHSFITNPGVWQKMIIPVKLSSKNRNANAFISKTGDGAVFIDDVGIVLPPPGKNPEKAL